MEIPKVYLLMERNKINCNTTVSEVYYSKEKAEKRLQEIEQDIARFKKGTIGYECFYQYYIKEKPYADYFEGIEFNTIDQKIISKEEYNELKLRAAWYEDIKSIIKDIIKELYPHIS